MQTDKDFSGIYRVVEQVVDRWLLHLKDKVDPSVFDVLFDKYHSYGSSLCDFALLSSGYRRLFLPAELTEDIVNAINRYGVEVECNVYKSPSHSESVFRLKSKGR